MIKLDNLLALSWLSDTARVRLFFLVLKKKETAFVIDQQMMCKMKGTEEYLRKIRESYKKRKK